VRAGRKGGNEATNEPRTHRSSSFFIFAAATIFIDFVIFWMFVVDVIRARSSCSEAMPRTPMARGLRSDRTVHRRLIVKKITGFLFQF